MINFFKKHKFKIFTYLFCAFALTLFTILSFGCKTYAFTIDSNGNLVGDNLFDLSSFEEKTTNIVRGNITYFNDGFTLTSTNNDCFTSSDNGQNSYYIDTNYNSSISLSCNTTNTYGYSIIIFEYDINWNSIDLQARYSSNSYFTSSFNLNSNTKYINIRFGVNNANNSISFSNIMINIGSSPLPYEPFGVWYSDNNYNAVVQDNEDLQEQIKNRTTKELQSGIKVNLNRTNLQIYNSSNLSLSQMLSTTPFHLETILFPNNDFNYDMQKCNLDTYNAIINNGGEFTNGDTLTNDPTLLYTFKTPLYIDSLTFSRNGTEGTRYINLYFSDSTSVELVLTEGSENNRSDITWVNSDNKYIEYISTTAEINYNAVVFFSIPNSSQIYSSGYSNGYSDGMFEQYQSDSALIENANQSKQAMYNQGYSKGYQDAASKNDVGWQSLFFAMADTPIRVVSNVLGFELFGLNLFSTFIGMVTVFAVVWLIKKFI